MTGAPAGSAAALPRPATLPEQAAAENFPVASRLLRKAERRHLMALYGFARLIDDLGDELPGTTEERLGALDAAEEELDRTFGLDSPPTHPVFVRLASSVKELSLPRQPFSDLIQANRVDQQVTTYETYDELLGYCRLSANPVGRLVLAIFAQVTPERLELSDDICTGLQLIEHWQDVAEDASKGRCYLPREDLDRFGVPTTAGGLPDVTGPVSPAFTRLIAFETSRAARLLTSGARLVGTLTGWARLAVAGYLGGGLAQIEALGRTGYDVVSGRPKASKGAVARQVAGTLVRASRGGL